jgi:radical SAM superfamily enzyme YgiQ (UPF0313 family)
MTDVLLVNPLYLNQDPVERRLVTPYFPLGLLYLAAVARDGGYSVAVYDGMFEETDEAFREALARHQPRLVGIAALATVRGAAQRLAGIAKEFGTIVVLGGADPTGRPEAYLGGGAHDGAVDIVVMGEGEQTFVELLRRLSAADWRLDAQLEDLRGLALPDGQGGIRRTSACPHQADLDSLPFPARDLINVERYQAAWRDAHGYSSLSVIAGRGCPYGCTWCQKSVFGRSYRMRSPESVAEEIGQIKERYHPDQIRVVDDVLGIDRRWLKKWHDALLAQDAVIPFEALSRVDLVDEEMIRLLREIGCRRLAFGAESGSQKVLDAMQKGTRVEQIRRAAELCRKHGIETYFYIMLGYPGEEWTDIQATIDLLRATRPDEFSSTVAYPLPGTEFYEQVQDRLVPAADWQHSAENRLLFQRRYSTRFYHWTQRLLRNEWLVARLAHGDLKIPPARRARLAGSRLMTRAAVLALRRMPGNAEPLPEGPPNLVGGA